MFRNQLIALETGKKYLAFEEIEFELKATAVVPQSDYLMAKVGQLN